MKDKTGQTLFVIVAVIQTILHYLGLLGILMGVIVLIFVSKANGISILIGGISLIILKYFLGIIFHIVVHTSKLDNEG